MPDKHRSCLLVGFARHLFDTDHATASHLNQICRGKLKDSIRGASRSPDFSILQQILVDKGLKGLGREYTIYHYVTPAAHLLVGTAGIWTLLPYYQSGVIVYEKKRWKSKGGGFLQSYLRLFGQENMGRPEIEAETEIESTKRYLARLLPEGSEVPAIKVLLLFTSPKAELKVENAPLPAITPKDLKDFMREKSKVEPIDELALDKILRLLPKPEREE